MNLEDYISLVGKVENPFPFMANSDLFILSSKSEGLPGVLIQALICNAQVISTDCPHGPNEILKNGFYGGLVKVNNHIQLANGIIDQLEVLKQTEVANVEDVLNRSSKMQQLMNQVENQETQIKDLKGDLQTARRELVHARQRVEVEKYKTNLEQSSNRADMASKLYAARTEDELKKVKTVVAEQDATNDQIIPLEE